MNNDFVVTDEFVELILEIKTLFEYKSIKYWLDEGTLLGVVRDGSLINGDHDFDFSAGYCDLLNIIDICKALKHKGYNIKYQSGLPYVEDMIQIYLLDDHLMNNIHVDINIYYFSFVNFCIFFLFFLFFLSLFPSFFFPRPLFSSVKTQLF